MLEFFRKYQRYFFIFITTVIIASFSFFGTFSTFSGGKKREDRMISKAVDGSPIMLSEIQSLTRFIGSDREDGAQYGITPNLCNDGVVRYDLLRTGLGDLLVACYFDALKGDFESRLDRVKRFRPYAHPEVPFLNAEAVWSQFLPAMKREWSALKGEKEAALSTFSRLSRLYQQQSYLTPETMKRILFFQHQQLGLNIDPSLQYGDLSLFGFHSLTDWFGKDFLTLSSEFILNAAAVAEAKGYYVSLEEAKADLSVRFHESLGKLQGAKEGISYSQHLRSLGFDEKSAAEVWRKVLLFRRYFQGVSQTAFVDRLPYKDFAMYARETATVFLYQWPVPLHLKSLQDLVEFQYYLLAVAPQGAHPLDLPDSYFSPEFVEENYPELVQSGFKAKVKEISLAETALQAPVKEVWEWQLDEKNWDALKAAYSFLSQGCTREERFQSLEKLSPLQRSQVDSYARLKVLDLHPEWKEQILNVTSSSDQILSISKASCSLSGVEKPWRLHGLLQRAASGNDEAKIELLAYSDDGKTLYRIEEVQKVRSGVISTFAEAKSQGLIGRIADRSLFATYSKIRSKFPAKFQSEEGGWKPFAEVKAEVAKQVFPEVFEEIEAIGSKTWTDDLYAQYRLYPATSYAYKALQDDPEDDRFFLREPSDRLEDQFKLERREMPIQRTAQEIWMKEKAFVMVPNEWSPIRVPPDGELSFFYLIDKKPCENPVLDQIAFGKELIAADAQRYLAEKLLETILKKHAIVLPQEEVQ